MIDIILHIFVWYAIVMWALESCGMVYGELSTKYETVGETLLESILVPTLLIAPLGFILYPYRVYKDRSLNPLKLLPQEETYSRTNTTNSQQQSDGALGDIDVSIQNDDQIRITVKGSTVSMQGYITDESAAKTADELIRVLKERNT